MKTFTFKSFLGSVAAVTLLTSANAGGAASGGASEWTQLAQFGADTADRANAYTAQLTEYREQAIRWTKTVEQYADQMRMYQTMVNNLGTLPTAQWNEFQQSVMGLKQALEFQDALAFTASSYNTDFNNMFPGYDKWVTDSKNGSLDFQATYKQLGDSTRDTVNGSLKALNVRAEDMQTDEQTMRTLSNLSQSAVGQKSAIQAASQIALHQTNQLKKLEQTMMIQANMQGEYIAMENEKAAFQEAQAKAKASEGIKPTLGDEKQVTPW